MGKMNKSNKKKRVHNMVNINPTILIITLSINGLNVPVKRHCQGQNNTQIYVVYKKLTININTHTDEK